MQPLISIIVPVYKMERYLNKCVDSILAQDYSHYELILVDDGSPDTCGEICDEYARADGRISVIHQQNKGLSVARNVGIAGAKGEWFTLVDADDWVEPTYLSYLYQLSRASDGNMLIACNHWIERGSGNQACFDVSQGVLKLTRRDASENVLYHREPDVSAWAKLYPIQMKAWLNYPQGRLYEDTYVFGELLQRTDGVIFGAIPQYHYRCDDKEPMSISKAGYTQRSWEYCEAVERMTGMIGAMYPELKDGCTRRNLHAYLSLRRLLVHCPKELLSQRLKINRMIKKDAKTVLRDSQTPMRDRLALISLGMGDIIFNWAWTAYQKHRNR